MSNLVPHFILESYAKNERNGRFQAAALFVDISGFSVLTDRLMVHGQHGAEVLAGVMGDIFEPLINAVYSQGGFVTGFAGDAFTAVFPDTDSSTALRALAAAEAIQKQMQARPDNDPYRQKALDIEGRAGKFLTALDTLGREPVEAGFRVRAIAALSGRQQMLLSRIA